MKKIVSNTYRLKNSKYLGTQYITSLHSIYKIIYEIKVIRLLFNDLTAPWIDGKYYLFLNFRDPKSLTDTAIQNGGTGGVNVRLTVMVHQQQEHKNFNGKDDHIGKVIEESQL